MWERLRRVDPLVWDSLLAATVFVVTVVAAIGARQAPGAPPQLGGWG